MRQRGFQFTSQSFECLFQVRCSISSLRFGTLANQAHFELSWQSS